LVHNVTIRSRPGGGTFTCIQVTCECGEVILDPSVKYTSSIGLAEVERLRWQHINPGHPGKLCPEGSGCPWCDPA
jgi:hypothetical protein